MRKLLPILLLGIILLGCEQGLQPVAGFQGTVTLPSDSSGVVIWPDSLEGAVVTFAATRSLDPKNLSFQQIIQNFLGFSQPLDTTRHTQEYFLQALPTPYSYVAGVVATTVPITQLLGQPVDSLSAHPEYFKVLGLYGYKPNSLVPFGLINVKEGEVTENINFDTDYDFEVEF
ncbi:MAG: hypothetical protein MAGBODY4_00140 [Candidatus Marinimicrobia bacterium]|nr:hypothetical protein [Candidatus Neomarinimicrobiota bacterium]